MFSCGRYDRMWIWFELLMLTQILVVTTHNSRLQDYTYWCGCMQAWKMYKSNELWHLVDPKLGTEIGTEEIIRFIKIGLLCLQQMPANRPKMSTVIAMLLDGTQVETICLEAESEYGSVDSYHATTTTARLCVVGEEEESSLLATSA
jgi:hypothetical protein